jgi:hypothetical protein
MGTDPELDRLIRRWSPPSPSAEFDRRMLARFRSARGRRFRWRSFLEARLSVPMPLVAATLLVAVCLLVFSSRTTGGPRERMAGFEPVASPRMTITRAEVTP